MTGMIKYAHDDIQDACQILMSATQSIADKVTGLVSQVQNNTSEYLFGAAAQAYSSAAADIASTFNNEVNYLQQTAQQTLKGSQAIQDDDQRLAKGFH